MQFQLALIIDTGETLLVGDQNFSCVSFLSRSGFFDHAIEFYVSRTYSDFVARDTSVLIRVTDQVTAELTNRYLKAK